MTAIVAADLTPVQQIVLDSIPADGTTIDRKTLIRQTGRRGNALNRPLDVLHQMGYVNFVQDGYALALDASGTGDYVAYGGSSADTLANDSGYLDFIADQAERDDPEGFAAAQWPAPPADDDEEREADEREQMIVEPTKLERDLAVIDALLATPSMPVAEIRDGDATPAVVLDARTGEPIVINGGMTPDAMAAAIVAAPEKRSGKPAKASGPRELRADGPKATLLRILAEQTDAKALAATMKIALDGRPWHKTLSTLVKTGQVVSHELNGVKSYKIA